MAVLFSYNIELINVIITEISLLTSFVEAFSHLNFVIAQTCICIIIAQSCTLCQVFLSISVTKILLVRNFSWIFPFDPTRMGHMIIFIALIISFLPCMAVSIYETVHGQLMLNTVAYLVGQPPCQCGISFLQAYLMAWALLAFCSLILASVYIPHQLKVLAASQSIKTGEIGEPKKEINLKRILLGLFGTIFHLTLANIDNYSGIYRGLPVNGYSGTTSLNIMLVYFLLDDGVWDCTKRNLLKKFPFLTSFVKGRKVAPGAYQCQV